jgi:hypothetical protein
LVAQGHADGVQTALLHAEGVGNRLKERFGIAVFADLLLNSFRSGGRAVLLSRVENKGVSEITVCGLRVILVHFSFRHHAVPNSALIIGAIGRIEFHRICPN